LSDTYGLAEGQTSVRQAGKNVFTLVPALIFVVVSSAGAVACSRWLPDLAPGSVGDLAFFLVCGLAGAAAGLLAMHIYLIVGELNHFVGGNELARGEVLAGGIRNLTFEVGSLIGFASVVYLLAPALELDVEPETDFESEQAA
jgi:hypothetical protein